METYAIYKCKHSDIIVSYQSIESLVNKLLISKVYAKKIQSAIDNGTFQGLYRTPSGWVRMLTVHSK